MAPTVTTDIDATLQQICEIMRVAVPSQDDVDALPAIAKNSQIPVIADMPFHPNTSSPSSTPLRRRPRWIQRAESMVLDPHLCCADPTQVGTAM
jgi:hypothetical protein